VTTELRQAIPAAISNPAPPANYRPLNQIVRERLELSDEPNPGTVVEGLVDELPDDLLRLAAQKGLHVLASEVARADRRPVSQTPSGSAKWESVALAERERPDSFGFRMCIGHDGHGVGIWKLLGDCGKRDLAGAAEVKQHLADGLLRDMDRMKRLERALKRDQIVRDLDRSKVEAIFNA
jgi:hypothetical protein